MSCKGRSNLLIININENSNLEPWCQGCTGPNYVFIETEFGVKARVRFKKEVRRVNNLLKTNPEFGPVEPLLADLPVIYHSVVVKRLNKIVYHISETHIEISDFWDVRREPETLSKSVK